MLDRRPIASTALCALLLGGTAFADPTELSSKPVQLGPICHYLDRGFDDHKPGIMDSYAITPHGIETLADIDHIGLGLDLPVSHCEEQSHSVPCADHDDPLQWCVRRVALSVLGFDLFDASEPNGCLLRPRPGLSGMRFISNSTLRNHPLWGLTEDELSTLINGYDPVSGSFNIPSIRFSSGYLSRQLEGLVGEQLASYVKGCANQLYCGNRRGRLFKGDVLPFWSRSSKVDCDLGNCPGLAARRSSPWVELKGMGDRLHVDFDIEVDYGLPDLNDSAKLGTKVLPYYGSTYKPGAWGSLSTDLRFECRKFARIDDEEKLPLCSQVDNAVCFQPGPQIDTTFGTVSCPNDEDHDLCGQTIGYDRSHDLGVTVDHLEFESEGGVTELLEPLLDVGCVLFGNLFKEKLGLGTCTADTLFGTVIQDKIDTSMLGLVVQDGLESCPAIEIEPDGSVVIDFSESGGLDFEQQAWIQGASQSLAASTVEGATTPRPELPRPVASNPVPSRRIAALARLTGETTPRADEKIPMAQLDTALRLICALSSTCPGLDLSVLPIEAFAELGDDPLNLPPVELLTILQPLLDAPAFRQCVGGDEDPLQLTELTDWLMTHFQPALDHGRCATLSAEKLLPLVGLELRLETAGPTVGDTFAFADFGIWKPDSGSSYACMKQTVYPPAQTPQCDSQGKITKGPEDSIGMACGTVPGGPCHDIRNPHPDWNRSKPEDEAYHPNGDFSWFTRCGDDHLGREMVCATEFYSGAGTNLAGTCKLCGEPGQDDDPHLFTTIGCEPEAPEADEPCPPGQLLSSDGRCWDMDAGLPDWECEVNCRERFNEYGWCVRNASWRSWMETKHPYFADNPSSYPDPICAEHTSCTQSGVPCAAVGKVCQPDTETCGIECTVHADCQAHSPAPAYPEGFLCYPDTLTCKL